jgi:hypothetical protein
MVSWKVILFMTGCILCVFSYLCTGWNVRWRSFQMWHQYIDRWIFRRAMSVWIDPPWGRSCVISLRSSVNVLFILSISVSSHRISYLLPRDLNQQSVKWRTMVMVWRPEFNSWQGQDFPPLHNIQTDGGALPASYPVSTVTACSEFDSGKVSCDGHKLDFRLLIRFICKERGLS